MAGRSSMLAKRQRPEIRAIKLQQVEGLETGPGTALATVEKSVEIGPAAFVAGARLAVQDEALELPCPQSRRDARELDRPIPPIARPQVHAVDVLPRYDAEAIVLHGEEPAGADWRLQR